MSAVGESTTHYYYKAIDAPLVQQVILHLKGLWQGLVFLAFMMLEPNPLCLYVVVAIPSSHPHTSYGHPPHIFRRERERGGGGGGRKTALIWYPVPTRERRT